MRYVLLYLSWIGCFLLGYRYGFMVASWRIRDEIIQRCCSPVQLMEEKRYEVDKAFRAK